MIRLLLNSSASKVAEVFVDAEIRYNPFMTKLLEQTLAALNLTRL